MAKSPLAHIQKTAPGPPIAMAVATPAMFPLPMAPASMVIIDCQGEISPAAPASPRRPVPR